MGTNYGVVEVPSWVPLTMKLLPSELIVMVITPLDPSVMDTEHLASCEPLRMQLMFETWNVGVDPSGMVRPSPFLKAFSRLVMSKYPWLAVSETLVPDDELDVVVVLLLDPHPVTPAMASAESAAVIL